MSPEEILDALYAMDINDAIGLIFPVEDEKLADELLAMSSDGSAKIWAFIVCDCCFCPVGALWYIDPKGRAALLQSFDHKSRSETISAMGCGEMLAETVTSAHLSATGTG